ncbi:hypothetical protein [Poseidonocella sp. HB161398]|uniref:hypothetical protein n=1 Tax=Poseidonocella sp. HB161398 TaxID=2320855 RepID=UPI0014867A9A|nr:hypothetical protein [Poseidonocella sp. HB161398]
MQSFYRLDGLDRIVECGGDWDRFCLENGSPALLAHHVQGRMLWDHVDGIDMTSYLGAIFFHVRRSGKVFAIRHRCDSALMARLFEMSTEPAGEGLLVTHRLIWEERLHDGDWLPRMEDVVEAPRCSVCCRFHLDGAWVDPLRLSGRVLRPSAHCLCTACKQELRERLDEAAREGKGRAQG